jgi:hypothetical protein
VPQSFRIKPGAGVAGMLKYVTKFAMDILPSVIATIIGAYIVNHYIVAKPGADAPVAAAVSSADPKKDDARSSGKSVDVANLPEPGVKAKGISERAVLEKAAAEKSAVVEKPAEKSADKPAETASIPADIRRQQPMAPREKAVAKSAPAAPSAPATVAAPVVAAPNTAPTVEATVIPEEHRDANDLARAAIERLRGASDGSPRTPEAARTPDAVRVPDAARVVTAPPVVSPPVATPVRPLPPPIMVSAPSAETSDAATGSTQVRPSAPAIIGDPHRPIPPADIPMASPSSRPLDLRADATEPLAREHTTVAEDMLSAAKSVFHAVLPK